MIEVYFSEFIFLNRNTYIKQYLHERWFSKLKKYVQIKLILKFQYFDILKRHKINCRKQVSSVYYFEMNK